MDQTGLNFITIDTDSVIITGLETNGWLGIITSIQCKKIE